MSGWPKGTPAILHVDMDAFFASVELLRHPELVGQPVAVGGSGNRGVVAAASYEARRYGVRSAMSSVRARALCPDLVFIGGDHKLYSQVSKRVMAIFNNYTPLVEALSLDEAFLDVTGSQRLHGDPVTIAHKIRADVMEAEGLSCCVGVSAVKFLAKLASPMAKPKATMDGITPGPGVLVIPPGEELEFLHPLELRQLWGVGPATLKKLSGLGISTIGELAALSLSEVTTFVGEASGTHLHNLANGVDDRAVIPHSAAKSVSHEETFGEDLMDRAKVNKEITRLGDAVARRLRVANIGGRTVNLKVRYSDFSTLTRSKTLPEATDSGRVIVATAKELMDKLAIKSGIRLLGVGVSSIGEPAAAQLSLEGNDDQWDDAEKAIDDIRNRFGSSAIGPAVLTDQQGLRVKEKGDQQWGPTQTD